MKFWIAIAKTIDNANEYVGRAVLWLVGAATLISALNALARYGLGRSSNAWLEIQWYLFAAIVMLGASYTLRMNEHVRVDIVYTHLSERGKEWLDLIGTAVFLVPSMLVIAWESLPFFLTSWQIQEMSGNAGGLLRWPVRLLIPVGFTLLLLQMVSELIKRIAVMRGLIPDPYAGKGGSH